MDSVSCISFFLDSSPVDWPVQNRSMCLHASVCLYHKAWFSVYSTWIPPTIMSFAWCHCPLGWICCGGGAAVLRFVCLLTSCHAEYVVMGRFACKIWELFAAGSDTVFLSYCCWFVGGSIDQFLSPFQSVCKLTCKSDKEKKQIK